MGSGRSVWSPRPSWPAPLAPQAKTRPSSSTATLWRHPAAARRTASPRNALISVGTSATCAREGFVGWEGVNRCDVGRLIGRLGREVFPPSVECIQRPGPTKSRQHGRQQLKGGRASSYPRDRSRPGQARRPRWCRWQRPCFLPGSQTPRGARPSPRKRSACPAAPAQVCACVRACGWRLCGVVMWCVRFVNTHVTAPIPLSPLGNRVTNQRQQSRPSPQHKHTNTRRHTSKTTGDRSSFGAAPDASVPTPSWPAEAAPQT